MTNQFNGVVRTQTAMLAADGQVVTAKIGLWLFAVFNDAINQNTVGSAVVGTTIGALAGAALGGNHEGAAVGAGMGLLMGSSVGSSNAQSAGYGSQRGYDSAYVQCMYARGHQIPVYGRMLSSPGSAGPAYGAPMAPPPPPPPPGYWHR